MEEAQQQQQNIIAKIEPALTKKTKVVGILGGTFDPPTICHMEIATTALSNNLADEIWVIPCGTRQDKITLTAGKIRLEMVDIAIEHIINMQPQFKGRLFSNSKEIQNGKSIPTYFLMKQLIEEHSDIQFKFIIGYDLVNSLERWDRGANLIKEINFIIAAQEHNMHNHSLNSSSSTTSQQDPIKLPNHYEYMLISEDERSTEHRKLLRESYSSEEALMEIKAKVIPNVFAYIDKHQLYKPIEVGNE